jgi:hypothetical protein
MKDLLRRVKLRAQELNLDWSPPEVGQWEDFPSTCVAQYRTNRERLLGDRWKLRHRVWPFATVNGTGPFSRKGPYPAGWEKVLAERTPPDAILELHFMTHYWKGRMPQKVMTCFKYFFDWWPQVLPPEIGRPPYWVQLSPEDAMKPRPPAL